MDAAKRIKLGGIVQGVGFRPFVYNLATSSGLHGWVRNTSAGVEIEVEGEAGALTRFLAGLQAGPPRQARIETFSVQDVQVEGRGAFAIRDSLPLENAYQLLSPDIATCPECLGEILDPADRRHNYPFTNCTNCGPRFTIIEDIPYDRSKTTMRLFPMCPSCRGEYENPANRRFHAQPNACPACGPRVWLQQPAACGHVPGGTGSPPASPVVDAAEGIRGAGETLRRGGILALKGLGGFQLACDATNEQAVELLRARKRRPHKPFALMMRTVAHVREHCILSEEEETLLSSAAAPILLLARKPTSRVAPSVAPAERYLGVMLPCSPLHHLLMREVNRPLVMTSGNLSEEPIARENAEALQRLGGIADLFLMHDRGIHARYDDSVWFVPLGGTPQPIRRARGDAPSPLRLPFSVGQVLACGAQLKNTFCLTRDRFAFVSQHVGDLENMETLEHFEETVALYEGLFRTRPDLLVCDLHPDYLSSRYAAARAERENLPLLSVQHHHAHIAGCMADNRWPPDRGPVIGVALDGTGYGEDGCVWGGEFLLADYGTYRRPGHLEYFPLPGGDHAIRRPARVALACLETFLGSVPDLPFLEALPRQERDILHRMVDRGLQTPMTSSCGRLFDAVSALLGICLHASYEGQPAIELEMAAGNPDAAAGDPRTYPFAIETEGEVKLLRLKPLFEATVADIKAGRPVEEISAVFHRTVVQMIENMCILIRDDTGVGTVALSGGCFQNRLLLRLTVEALAGRGFSVLVHRRCPANDGGLSLGQAMTARSIRKEGG